MNTESCGDQKPFPEPVTTYFQAPAEPAEVTGLQGVYYVEQKSIETQLVKAAITHILRDFMFAGTDTDTAKSIEWALSKLIAFKVTCVEREPLEDSRHFTLSYASDGMMIFLDCVVGRDHVTV